MTTRLLSRAAAALAIVALLTGPATAQVPTEPPPAMPLAPPRFPPFREARLKNGLELVLVENHQLPIVSIRLSIPTGAVQDPAGQRGLADFVAELLTKGTSSRSAEQIAAEIEGAGGSLSADAGDDFLTISATVLADRTDLAFALLGEVLRDATYPDAELELARRRSLSALQFEKSQPEAIADRQFARAIYRAHPYGSRPTEATLRAITRESVQRFAAEQLKPGGSLLVVAGDIDLDGVRKLAERHLGSWRGRVPARTYGEPPVPRATEILLVHRPGSEQSNIVYGNLGLRPGARDYYAATVANKVLGGGADARLFLILREQKGWTYGAYSRLERPYDVGTFQATAEVRTAVTDSALTELLAQIRRIRAETIPDSELAAAKGYLAGVFPLTIETPQQIAGQVALEKRLHLGDDYLERYRDRIDAVSATDARRAIAGIVRPDSAVIVVVGDGSKIYDKLTPIAPVRIVDVDGHPLSPDDLATAPEALSFDLEQLRARTDSFQVVIQGTPMGSQVSELREEADGLVYLERTAIPLIGLTQETRVVMDPTSLAARSVDQNGRAAGQPAETHVTFAEGRVRGRAQTPGMGGQPKVTEVDTTVAAGTLDVNQLQAVVPALPLAEGASFTAMVFNSADASIKPFTVAVESVEDVTVPAGTFSVFRVSLAGGSAPATLYVTRETPRRVVKLEIVGQPILFELVR
jgi:zinc protease